jgi:uncharacterized protein YodC (DUF2158 family)
VSDADEKDPAFGFTDFAPGDIVVLRSGGPAMTVARVSEAGVVCCWFDKDWHAYELRELNAAVLRRCQVVHA